MQFLLMDVFEKFNFIAKLKIQLTINEIVLRAPFHIVDKNTSWQ